MYFSEMETGFQHAFAAAIRAYRRGSTPIGCAVTDQDGNCISSGENSIYSRDKTEIINGHHLAHAEINAILKLDRSGNSGCTLYTTMEPCALCFGAVVMSDLRRVKFAAYDKYSGAACLKTATPFITERHIDISGPYEPMQTIQVALLVHRLLSLGIEHNNGFMALYKSYCPDGVALGEKLSGDAYFAGMLLSCDNAELIVDYMFSLFCERDEI